MKDSSMAVIVWMAIAVVTAFILTIMGVCYGI